MLRHELNYPEDRALHFVKRFDHNKDGRLSASEFGQFKSKIAEAYVQQRHAQTTTTMGVFRGGPRGPRPPPIAQEIFALFKYR